MDTFLDLQSLVDEKRKQDNGRLDTFKKILQQCFAQIKRYNKDKIYEMDFKIPRFQLSVPRYDIETLKNYLVHHLTDNGLKVIILADGYTLYISWKETDINLEQYLKKKQTLATSIFNLDGTPITTEDTATVSPMTMFYRQAKQQQMMTDRENRFSMQRSRFQAPQKPRNIY
jgi:hypothetical protein